MALKDIKSTYHLWILVFSIILFLNGYFPIKPDRHERSSDKELPVGWRRKVGQTVIVIIDALRADFVLGEKGNLPKIEYLWNLVNEGKAVATYAKASAPTVTLPRIKSIVTGGIPGFVDVIRNFNSEELLEDSLVSQWKSHNMSILMFGDDTWSKLFPNSFTRLDPTTSFFVTDYTEVDQNVTRHLEEELGNDDWDVMILHYLGLDHIGHLAGPYSQLIPAKLEEMGEVLKIIHERLVNKAYSKNVPPAIFVMGDHGMADSGSHGGASYSEVMVPIVGIGPQFKGGVTSHSRHQVDVNPVLAALTGVPIPSGSIGRIIPEMVPGMGLEDSLYALRYNAEKMATVVDGLAGVKTSGGDETLKESVRMHAQWLTKNEQNLEEAILVEEMFLKSMDGLQSVAQDHLSKYDLYVLGVSIVLLTLCTALGTLISFNILKEVNPLVHRLFFVMLGVGAAHCLVCAQIESYLCSVNSQSIAMTFVSVILVSWITATLMANIRNLELCPKLIRDANIKDKFVILGTLLHLISLMSSSFIEEEHQTFYFLQGTLLALRSTSVAQPVTLFALLLHRFLKSVNQTGDKWRSLKDTGDWLNQPEHRSAQLLMFVVALGIVYLVSARETATRTCKLFNLILLIFIFFQKLANSPEHLLISRSIYFLILINASLSSCSYKTRIHTGFVFLCLSLHTPNNCVVIAGILILCSVTPDLHPLSSLWMAKTAYFYLGNSNSLATVDVGAGYTGLSSFSPGIVSTLMAVHTFTGPIIVISFLLKEIKVVRFIPVYFAQSSAELALFAGLCTALRYHLFVWTVFSPKLLYEGMYVLVLTLLSTLMSIVE